jgi:DmsE family decaheme c-type cytochrome
MSARIRIGGFTIAAFACAMIMGVAGPSFAARAAQDAAPQASGASAPAAEQPMYSDRGAATCMKCHDEAPVTDILKTPHGMKGDSRTPFGQHECESCHGPSQAHVSSSPAAGQHKVRPNVVFVGPNASPAAERNKVCLSCHENGLRMNWKGSKHDKNQVACNSCHTIHATKDPVLVKATQPEKCFTCHAAQRAESFQYSHHPIREGLVVCADCHNPHGSPGPKMLKEFTVNETCYNCHTEKRGPMLWEHQPVRDNCTNCHTPHGSTEPRLLKERMNFLCSSCHSAASSNSGGAFGGAHAIPGNLLGTATFAAYLANQRMCLNCHSQVHGSNSPNGAYFFR